MSDKMSASEARERTEGHGGDAGILICASSMVYRIQPLPLEKDLATNGDVMARSNAL